MQKLVAMSIAVTMSLVGAAALAQTSPEKSERAMSGDSAKAGQSPNEKSERAMDPAAGKPGSAPNGKSERAMPPEQK